jgi:hypothetical protein
MLLAASGMVLWIIYLAADTKGWAWACIRGPARRRQPRVRDACSLDPASASREQSGTRRRRRNRDDGRGQHPAEQHFPVPIVIGHGLIAATTLVLVLLAALDVGGS